MDSLASGRWRRRRTEELPAAGDAGHFNHTDNH
ncbi:mCG1046832, isoform CRA_b [Mus musculus]|nr:mCG1046832, isoform CRA_b [Mus musculus]